MLQHEDRYGSLFYELEKRRQSYWMMGTMMFYAFPHWRTPRGTAIDAST